MKQPTVSNPSADYAGFNRSDKIPYEPIMVFWMYRTDDIAIPSEQARVLKQVLLKLTAAQRVTLKSNGTLVARFKNRDAVERAHDTILLPLQMLMGGDDLRVALHSNPFVPAKNRNS